MSYLIIAKAKGSEIGKVVYSCNTEKEARHKVSNLNVFGSYKLDYLIAEFPDGI
jgi:hypothetical protein